MKRAERGSGLIVIIVVIAFLLAVGIMVVTVTSTGPKVSGNVRNQEEAFNAAEAGFDASRKQMENLFLNGTWFSFDGHYLEQPAGIDMPTLGGAFNPLYFRSLSDEELLGLIDPNGDGIPDLPNTIFFQQPFTTTQLGADDLRYTYTAFLINDEAGAGSYDSNDVLLVSIGVVRAGTAGTRVLATSRLEIVFAVEGTNP
jgi:hypothetical protein